ncbi:hypothetical protein DV515_00017964 [Chloebia gouldiae]|uniref:Uncharacterized protein n=1 Tax=Chloebia gouldiae TaxID=44316 RepID=A0A3L8Q919_CHLGU|nr:hypothetical protein DV515_00017964 [Chloebia gouldiae]
MGDRPVGDSIGDRPIDPIGDCPVGDPMGDHPIDPMGDGPMGDSIGDPIDPIGGPVRDPKPPMEKPLWKSPYGGAECPRTKPRIRAQ